MTKNKLPKYGRIKQPLSMRLTERDVRILEAVHAFDGMLGFSQIKRMFFTGKSQAEHRLKLLYQHRYLNRPNRDQRRRVPEMIYWLDKLGAEIVASSMSTPFQGFKWRKQPHWLQVNHDLAVNTFRLDMLAACQASPSVELETWIPESEFKAYPDKVDIKFQNYKMKDRKVIPDGFFMLATPHHFIRYLLEIDRSTEDNPRFLREKILPGLEYVKSEAYEERFGFKAGRWLVVTTGEKRMHNMLNLATKAKTKGFFYFTTYAQITVESLLFEPIWRRADRDDPVQLLFID